MTVISESGLYKLVMRSDKPEARQFQDWVTRDVLPAIRKDGAYVMGEEKLGRPDLSLTELEAVQEQTLALRERQAASRMSFERNHGVGGASPPGSRPLHNRT